MQTQNADCPSVPSKPSPGAFDGDGGREIPVLMETEQTCLNRVREFGRNPLQLQFGYKWKHSRNGKTTPGMVKSSGEKEIQQIHAPRRAGAGPEEKLTDADPTEEVGPLITGKKRVNGRHGWRKLGPEQT